MLKRHCLYFQCGNFVVSSTQLFNDLESAAAVNIDVDHHNGQSDGHGHLPINQLQNPHVLLSPPGQQQQPQLRTTLQPKKKCRGNRREQRFRRRVREQNLEETAEKPVVQSRIADNTQIMDQNTMEEYHSDDDTIDMEEEQIQVASNYSQHKKNSYMSLLCLLLLIRNVLSTAPSPMEGSPKSVKETY